MNDWEKQYLNELIRLGMEPWKAEELTFDSMLYYELLQKPLPINAIKQAQLDFSVFGDDY